MTFQRPIQPRIRRDCREYERIWNDHCVDKNLADRWLEALNALSCFNLISICEGHAPAEHTSRDPHINLRLKPECFPIRLEDEKNFLQFARAALIQICDDNTTNTRVDYTQKFYNLGEWQRDLVVHFHARFHSIQDADFPMRSQWFDQMVHKSIQFDQMIKRNSFQAE